MARPHAAAIIEDACNQRINDLLVDRGWTPRAIAHTGYGSTSFIRVMGRIVLSRHGGAEHEAELESLSPSAAMAAGTLRERAEASVRGWRAFITAQAMNAPVVITVDGVEHPTRSDRSGYIDTVIDGHTFEPGWHEVTITPEGGRPARANVQIIGPDVRFGLVSDIDDTVMITALPRPMIAAWNTFVLHEQARHIVPGMAPMYRDLLAEHPGAPIFYLSTGAWNTSGNLTRFLKRHGYPAGALLLTDWGPTHDRFFRSGREHKRNNLERFAQDFPRLRWLLVGDDGQHDEALYRGFEERHPDRVAAVAIRQLSPGEAVLAGGRSKVSGEHEGAPWVFAGNGAALLDQLHGKL